MKRILVCAVFLCLTTASTFISVEGGRYKPIFGKVGQVKVKSFQIFETAVTNKQFLDFVSSQPSWQKGNVPALFADQNYLKHWKSPLEIGPIDMDSSPVVNVSWFAAKAFCENQGFRLPTVDEWEYLAQFGPPGDDKKVREVILEWYSKPNLKKVPAVKSTFMNKFGVWDVHGLIWEWNLDFNSVFVTGESRGDSALEKMMFCGSGAVGSANPEDYPAFMRFGFRSSLKGHYTLENLGFRCVKEVKK